GAWSAAGCGSRGRRRGCAGGRRRRWRRRGLFLLCGLFLQPGLKVLFRTRIDHDRHEAVIAAAQLRALPAVDTGLVGVDVEPGLVDEAWDRILLDAEGRHPPGVNDVGAGDQQADLDPDRHDERIVDAEQVMIDGVRVDPGSELTRTVALAIQPREEGDPLIEVVVVPAP